MRNADRINIVIRKWDSDGTSTTVASTYTIKSSSAIRTILRIYSIRESPFSNCYGYFKFIAGERILNGDETPIDLALSDGDCIDAVPCSKEDISGSRFV